MAAALLMLLPLSVEAKTLYVDLATGNDARSYEENGPSAPWATIGRAAWGSVNRASWNPGQAVRAGDVVVVRAGTYSVSASGGARYDPVYNPANGGSAGSPIVFQAEGRVVLQSAQYAGPVIGAYRRNYVVWDGFYIDEANVNTRADTGPVVVWDAQGCIIRNVEIRAKMAPWVDNHNGIRIEQANGTLIQNNLIYGVGSSGYYGQNDAAIMLYDSNDTIIENNTLHSSGVGVFVKGQHPEFTQDRTIIRRNHVYNMGEAGVMLLASRDAKVYQNVIHDSTWGMTVYSLGGGPTNDVWANNTVHNNSQGGIRFRGSLPNWSRIRFYNNIFTNSGAVAIGGESFPTPADAAFEHNVYQQFRDFAWFGSYRTFSNWRSTWAKDSAGPASLNGDPRYANGGGGDFRLCTGAGQPVASCSAASPALSLGVDILDLNGNGSTSDAIRAGAYVTGNEQIGWNRGAGSGTTLPQTPRNLRIVP